LILLFPDDLAVGKIDRDDDLFGIARPPATTGDE
jgi:hypothetical protein